jgi:hypothetical protein
MIKLKAEVSNMKKCVDLLRRENKTLRKHVREMDEENSRYKYCDLLRRSVDERLDVSVSRMESSFRISPDIIASRTPSGITMTWLVRDFQNLCKIFEI